jgi:hypothetical protein
MIRKGEKKKKGKERKKGKGKLGEKRLFPPANAIVEPYDPSEPDPRTCTRVYNVKVTAHPLVRDST